MGAIRRGGAADGLCPRCVLARAMATNCDVLRYDKERKSRETRNIPTDFLPRDVFLYGRPTESRSL
jgi:hypothetical protein